MKIHAIGLNHHNTPVEVRERVTYNEKDIPSILPRLKAAVGATECVVISTCNRVEAYLAHPDPASPLGAVRSFLEEDRMASGFGDHLFAHEGLEAIVHLFRVASGLDSMVVGENEILGQVKRAYLAAVDAKTTGKALNRAFQFALHVGKSVRTTTSISSGQVSIPSVAVSLAEKIFEDLTDRRAMVIGAGETGELTAATLRDRGLRSFIVLNRTLDKAERLAEKLGGDPADFGGLADQLARTDVVISCIASEGRILGRDAFRRAAAARKGHPLLAIDISVPRTIDPGVNQIDNVYLYDIDDLESISAENVARRAREIERCEEIIQREAGKLLASTDLLDVAEIIRKLNTHAESLAEEELTRTLTKLNSLSGNQKEAVQEMVHRLVRKLLHRPLRGMRAGTESQITAEFVRRLFDLK